MEILVFVDQRCVYRKSHSSFAMARWIAYLDLLQCERSVYRNLSCLGGIMLGEHIPSPAKCDTTSMLAENHVYD